MQRHAVEVYMPLKEGEEAHWEVCVCVCVCVCVWVMEGLLHVLSHLQVVERLLFLYAKTNTGIGYVQGMNEVIGPLYYVFAQHPDIAWKGAHCNTHT